MYAKKLPLLILLTKHKIPKAVRGTSGTLSTTFFGMFII